MFVMYHSDGSQWPAKQQNTMDGWKQNTWAFYMQTVVISIVTCDVCITDLHASAESCKSEYSGWKY